MPIIPNDTLSYVVNLMSLLDAVPDTPLSHSVFNLDSSGVAGFFGGESAVRATATVNLVAHRRWFGWYNAPGSYEVARQYSGLARSRLFDALFPSSDSNPAKILMVDGKVGPEYTPLYSPIRKTPLSIGHLGSLITRKVSHMAVEEALSQRKKGAIEPARVTFVKLNRNPLRDLNQLKLVTSSSIIILGIFTILISLGGCVGCVLVADWFCLASIALGIIANGVSCAVIGSGKLYLKHTPPPQVHAPGDVLLRTDTDIIVLIGTEGLVSPITHGRFDMRFRGMHGFITQPASHQQEPQLITQLDSQTDTLLTPYPTGKGDPQPAAPLRHFIPTFPHPRDSQKYLIDVSVILLLSQFLAQLLLIPQGTLFGQLMFVGTLMVSWIYNSYLSSVSLDLQTNMLLGKLSIVENEDIYQYELKTWTEAVVFACLFYRAIHPLPSGDAGQNPADWKKRVDEKAAEVEVAKKEAEDAEADVEKKKEEEGEAEKSLTSTQDMEKMWSHSPDSSIAVTAKRAVSTATTQLEDAKNAKRQAVDKAVDKVLVYDKKAKDKRKEVKRAEVADKEYNSFQRFLDALLPHKTDVRQAFTESLMRKIGETNVDPYETDRPPPFQFHFKDFLVRVPEGDNRVPNRDLKLLNTFQKDAGQALDEWKNFCSITNIDIQSWYD